MNFPICTARPAAQLFGLPPTGYEMDLVLGEPQADGLLALERVRADQDLGGGEGISAA